MVDTAVRPRPEFSTFLRSDVNAGGDGLSYFEYKRLLRSQKVARLQHKQALTRIPGYKFLTAVTPSQPAVAISQTVVQQPTVDKGTQTSSTQENEDIITEHKQVVIPPPLTNLTARPVTAEPISKPPRQIKSATTRSVKDQGGIDHQVIRPKTAGPTATAEQQREGGIWKLQQVPHHMNTETTPTGGAVTTVDGLIHSYRWSTSTQRAYNEVGWDNKLQHTTNLFTPSTCPPVQTLPDPVSLRFTNKRNELYPSQWQSLGNSWDGIQTRKTIHSNGVFCSPFRNTLQLPGYLGNVTGEPDRIDGEFVSAAIATRQPRPTTISRRPNIPGYSGCTHWSSSMPALTRMPYPNVYTTDYRSIPADSSLSPFIRTSPLSKMITLVSPFNPFNKIEEQ